MDSNTIQFPECRLSDGLELLFEEPKFSDVILYVAGSKFEVRAHRAILAARSHTFERLFANETEEHDHNRVEITDVNNHEVLREMLRFIHTGKALNLEKLARYLLAAADKHKLERLKAMCEQELFTKLSIENAAETLVLAHLHCADHLKAKAMCFIITHSKDVLNTPGFKSIEKTYPQIAINVLHALTSLHN